ncbi:FxsA family protein [Orbus wheelerorum]|uniref:FxsA family protein n=1 Tax=Orbus wheelerorum TaxID=3074111 RepID=UPI00370DD6BC
MRWLFLVLLFLYVYIEISLFVAVANSIGVLLALICIIATSVIGLSLVKSQGLKNLALIQQKMANNENPNDELVKSVSLLLAGLLLSIPGFFTDILGALLLLSPIQRFLVKRIVPKMSIKTYQSNSPNNNHNNEVIEGQFTHKNDE